MRIVNGGNISQLPFIGIVLRRIIRRVKGATLSFVFLITLLLTFFLSSAQTTQTFTASGTFTVPSGVNEIIVECWGGGGSGGGNTTNRSRGGGGGAGGSYARSVLSVADGEIISGATYDVVVAIQTVGTNSAGQKGYPSYFGSGSLVYAEGGNGGSAPNGTTSAGGQGSVASSIGDILFQGGNGADGSSSYAGGGGGGAGSNGNGGDASGTTAGTGTLSEGGNGGSGRTNEGDGNAGSSYGGGGAGAYIPDNTNHAGGNGAPGLVKIFYTTSPPTCTTPVLPTDGETDFAIDGTLSWNGSTGATGYYLYFGTDASATNIENGTDLGNVTSYSPSADLDFLTDYYWQVVPYNSYGNASGCSIWSFTTQDITYCEPSFSSGTSYGDYISLVQLESINNTTGASSSSPYYTYYSSLSTDLTIENSYTITLGVGSYAYGNNIAAWIDFNHDGDFEDSGEKLGELNSLSGNETGTINFSVPVDATPGTTRLRVREVYNTSDITSCDTYNYGETEDYNINLLNACNTPDTPTLTTTASSICSGESTTLNISTGNLNDADHWQWYSGSCGGTEVGQGNSISVSPETTTTYYARGEGNSCNGANCASITITVNSEPTLSGISLNTSICDGESGSINLEGLIPNSSFSVDYLIDGVSYASSGLTADDSGAATFSTSALTTADDGKSLVVSNITTLEGCSNNFSESLTLEVYPSSFNLSITSSPSGTVCNGTTVTYTATSNITGTNSTYQWTVNGINVGTNSNTYSYIPIEGDEVSCTLTTISDSPCLADPPFTYFSWDNTSNALTDSDYGLDAVSINDGQYMTGGVGGTNCLAPVVQNANIQLVFDGTESALNSDGLDFKISYRRAESTANLFTRGSSLNIGGGANFNVSYLVDNGSGTTTVSSPDFAIDDWDNFHDYRFKYNPVDGYGRLYIDDVQIWESSPTPGMPFYWTGAGDLVIGEGMDASGNQTPSLDNLSIAVVGEISASATSIAHVGDSEDPVPDIAILSDVTAECLVTSLTAPTATDNCTGSITGSHNATLPITAQGITVVTWTYDDGNGNISTQTQNVIIDDITDPSFTCPSATTVVFDASCQITVPDLLSDISDESDNCGTPTLSQSPVAGTVLASGEGIVHQVTITADDGNGNTSTCNVEVSGVAADPIDVRVEDLGNSCQSGETGSTTTIIWDLTKISGTDDWTFDYEIKEGTTTIASASNVSATGNTQVSVDVNNETAQSKTFTIIISNVKDTCGSNETSTVNNSDSVTLYGVPDTSDINTN